MSVILIETEYVIKTTHSAAAEKLKITDNAQQFTFNIIAVPVHYKAEDIYENLKTDENKIPILVSTNNLEDPNLYEFRYYAVLPYDGFRSEYVDKINSRIYTLADNRNVYHKYKIKSSIIKCNSRLNHSKIVWQNEYTFGNIHFYSNTLADRNGVFRGIPLHLENFIERNIKSTYIEHCIIAADVARYTTCSDTPNKELVHFSKPISAFDYFYVLPPQQCVLISGTRNLVKLVHRENTFYFDLIKKPYNLTTSLESESVCYLDTSKPIDEVKRIFRFFKFFNLNISPGGIRAVDEIGNVMRVGVVV